MAAQGKNIQAAAEREEADVAFKEATEDVHKEGITIRSRERKVCLPHEYPRISVCPSLRLLVRNAA